MNNLLSEFKKHRMNILISLSTKNLNYQTILDFLDTLEDGIEKNEEDSIKVVNHLIKNEYMFKSNKEKAEYINKEINKIEKIQNTISDFYYNKKKDNNKNFSLKFLEIKLKENMK